MSTPVITVLTPRRHRWWTLLVALAICAAGCGSVASSEGAGDGSTRPTNDVALVTVPETTQPSDATNRVGTAGDSDGPVDDGADTSQPIGAAPTSPLADLVTELPTALDIPAPSSGPTPTSMTFSAIGVSGAPIEPVGVEDNGEMEIPEATTIGWYEFGPRPGEAGSAVLAAHIAFDNQRGVFRFLDDSIVGDRFELTFDDGSTVSYELVERAQYDKDELPFDRVFAKDGPPVITLISCGGTFQRSISSYEDNIVAYAIPVT